MNRFFAFGCSFTQNNFRLTWADIIGREFDVYQNWAKQGAGNQFIFNSLIECNTRHKFTSDDTVIIMWTSVSREDRYVKDTWIVNGSVYNSNSLSEEWVREFACERGYLIRDLASISAASDLLKVWGVNYKFLSILPIVNPNELRESIKNDDNNNDITNLYSDVIQEIRPSVYEVIFNSENWNIKKSNFGQFVAEGVRDPHPDPVEALEYVQRIIPEVTISQETIDYVLNFKFGDSLHTCLPKRF
jgi:hypothetical protein